jgi:hypothetical protein
VGTSQSAGKFSVLSAHRHKAAVRSNMLTGDNRPIAVRQQFVRQLFRVPEALNLLPAMQLATKLRNM